MENKGFDREAMRITIDYNNMMQETLGARGLTTDELKALPLDAAAKAMHEKRDQMKWRELPHNQNEIVNAAARWARSRSSRRFRICIITICRKKSAAVRDCLSRITSIPSA